MSCTGAIRCGRFWLSWSGRGGRSVWSWSALARSEVAEQLQAICGSCRRRRRDRADLRRAARATRSSRRSCSRRRTRAAGELPGSLREALLLRVERLSELTREVLRVAAVVGRSVDHRLLASVVGVAEARVAWRASRGDRPSRAGAERGRDGVRVSPCAAARGDLRRHAGRRAAAASSARSPRRSPRTANTPGRGRRPSWPTTGTRPATQLAALAASVRGGDRGRARCTPTTRRSGTSSERWRCGTSVEAPRGRGRDRPDRAAAARVRARGVRRGRRTRRSRLPSRPARTSTSAPSRCGRRPRRRGSAARCTTPAVACDAVAHLAEARRLVPRDPPSLDYAEALAAEGRVLMLIGRMAEARDRLEEAIPIAELLGARAVQASALNSLAIVYANVGRARAIDRCRPRGPADRARRSGRPARSCARTSTAARRSTTRAGSRRRSRSGWRESAWPNGWG